LTLPHIGLVAWDFFNILSSNHGPFYPQPSSNPRFFCRVSPIFFSSIWNFYLNDPACHFSFPLPPLSPSMPPMLVPPDSTPLGLLDLPLWLDQFFSTHPACNSLHAPLHNGFFDDPPPFLSPFPLRGEPVTYSFRMISPPFFSPLVPP